MLKGFGDEHDGEPQPPPHPDLKGGGRGKQRRLGNTMRCHISVRTWNCQIDVWRSLVRRHSSTSSIIAHLYEALYTNCCPRDTTRCYSSRTSIHFLRLASRRSTTAATSTATDPFNMRWISFSFNLPYSRLPHDSPRR
jgi:hypothetical protein